jgi:DNA-binding NarL/FixJ family response regulator
MSDRIRLLIVDDHAVVRKGLAMVLRLEPDIEVVGEAENGRVGLEAARRLHPDLVLADLVMPEVDGQQMALALRKSDPSIKIMMLTGTEVDDRVYDLVAAGVEGYVLKNIEPGELVRAIHAVLEVLEWMATPNTYKQIAFQLCVSEETVRSHAKNILEKMKQPNRAQAVLAAMKMKLIKLNEQP